MKMERLTAEKAAMWVAKAREPGEWERRGDSSLQECLDNLSQENADKLACIEGMLGGLALMRVGAEHGDGWIRDGMEDALAEHFDAMEKILEEGRKVYAANVRTMEKAIA